MPDAETSIDDSQQAARRRPRQPGQEPEEDEAEQHIHKYQHVVR